jgi:hypothetical protein
VITEYNRSYVVLVENAEDEGGELGGVPVREKLLVDLYEALQTYNSHNFNIGTLCAIVVVTNNLLGEQPVRTVLQKPFVPAITRNALLNQTITFKPKC